MPIASIKQVPGVYHRRLGDFLVTALSDGYMQYDTLDICQGIPVEEIAAILASERRISPPRISINAFALRDGERTILVDCGSQDIMGPTCGRLPENLAVAGIAPESVDTILLTHVHPDHSNGLTEVATGRRLFPSAEVFVHENEIKHWFDDEQMAKATERQRERYFRAGRAQLSPYLDSGNVRMFQSGEILPNIIALPCPGHTPGHSSYLVIRGGESMVIWGDTVHVPEVQLARPEVAMVFDTDPQQGVRSRIQLFERILAEDILVAGMHAHFPGFAKMVKHGDRLRLVAEQWAFTL